MNGCFQPRRGHDGQNLHIHRQTRGQPVCVSPHQPRAGNEDARRHDCGLRHPRLRSVAAVHFCTSLRNWLRCAATIRGKQTIVGEPNESFHPPSPRTFHLHPHVPHPRNNARLPLTPAAKNRARRCVLGPGRYAAARWSRRCRLRIKCSPTPTSPSANRSECSRTIHRNGVDSICLVWKTVYRLTGIASYRRTPTKARAPSQLGSRKYKKYIDSGTKSLYG